MPSSVNVNGVTTYKPGVYGSVDASNVGAVQAAFGNMAVVGPFPTLKTNTPVVCASPQAVRALDPNSADFARIAKLAFNPGNDERVSGAGTVTLVNCQPVVQASKTLLDATDGNSLVLKSQTYGFRGNQVWMQMGVNAGDAAGWDFLFTLPGFQAEAYRNLQSGVVGKIRCDAADVQGADDTAKVTISSSSLSIVWEKAFAIAGGPVLTPTLVVSGVVQVKATAGAAPADMTWVIVGKDSTGAAKTANFTLAVAAQDGAYKNVTEPAAGPDILWSEIESIDANGGGANISALFLKGTAFSLTLSQFSKVSDVLAFINNQSGKGWKGTIDSPKCYQIPATEIDAQTAVNIKAADASLRSDLWAIVQGLSASKIVTASRATGASKPPKNNPTISSFLMGGTETAVTPSTDYAAAFPSIADKDIQVVAVLDSDIEAGKALKQHCTDAAVKFGRERNGWYGSAANAALATLKGAVNTLNSRNVALVADKAQIAPTIAGGQPEWVDPKYVAVACAGMQCGTPVATPLTNKVFDFLDISHSWVDGSDEDLVIGSSICALYKNERGLPACLRSVTTNNDNVFYSEVSANESINTSIRLLRLGLKALIGLPITVNMPPDLIKQLAIAELNKQVDAGYIKAFKNVQVTLQGDKYSVDYALAPVQPLNFIEVTAHLGQF